MFLTRSLFLVAALALAFTTVSFAQPPKGQGKGGAGQNQGNQFGQAQGQGQNSMPPFEPGQVLPPPVRRALNLSAEQEAAITQLEKEVKAQLEKILTAEQKKAVNSMAQGSQVQNNNGQGNAGLKGGGRPPGKNQQ